VEQRALWENFLALQNGQSLLAGSITNAKLGTDISPVNFANPYKFRVYQTTAGNLGASPGKILFDTKTFDTGSNVDIVTNKGRFTAPVSGFYYFSATVSHNVGSGNFLRADLYKNGSFLSAGIGFINSASAFQDDAIVSDFIQLAANDYIEVYLISTVGNAIGVGPGATYFSGFLVSTT
jgi:hypothetical protein